MTLGGVAFGAAVMGLITARAPSNDILNQLIKDQPEFYKFVDIDMSTARTNQVYDEPGTFIWVDNQFARGEVTLRLNELKFGEFDLRRQKTISGPFFRFFITNGTGQGVIRLFISRGYQAASEPLEAINRAELAARLGSIVTFDRGGDVLWYDNFEDGIEKWIPETSGAGSSISWSSTKSKTGSFACKLVTGSSLSHKAKIRRWFAYPVLSSVGFEYSFAIDSNLSYIQMRLWLFNGTTSYFPTLIYDYVNSKLQYVDTGLATQDIDTNFVLEDNYTTFNTIKIVIDFTNDTWVRVIANENTYNLDRIPIQSNPSGEPSQIRLDIECYSTAAVNSTIYIDDVIVTQNEP